MTVWVFSILRSSEKEKPEYNRLQNDRFFYIMNMMKKMNAVEIVRYINNEVGMDVAHVDDNSNVIIHANHDFFGTAVYFHDYLFCGDLIYSYINQQGFVSNDKPDFCTSRTAMSAQLGYGVCCFNPEGVHNLDCKFDIATGMREFSIETLKNSVEGLKKALKVLESSKLKIADEIEFMDI